MKAVSVQDASALARSFSGVVVARTQSDLGFRVSGKILQRLVDTGQTVKRGQPLMRMDPVDLNLQARAQQEAVTAARARAKQTGDDEARYRGLVADGAVSASSYDQIKAAADAAKAQLSAAQAQADVARNATEYAVLLADADGVVMDTLAEPGQVVSAGQAVVRLARAGQRSCRLLARNTSTCAWLDCAGHAIWQACAGRTRQTALAFRCSRPHHAHIRGQVRAHCLWRARHWCNHYA